MLYPTIPTRSDNQEVESRAARGQDERTLPVARLSQVNKAMDGGERGLHAVDLELWPGELVVLIGPRQSGKSAIFNLLFGLYSADSGEVELFGRNPRDEAASEQIGAMPQNVDFPSALKVYEVIDLVRAHYPNPASVQELVDRFYLSGVKEHRIESLDLGERLWLATALSFAGNPKAVFLDMVITGMQIEWQGLFWRLMREYTEDGGALLISMNRTDHIEQFASRIVVISGGRIIADGDAEHIKDHAGMERRYDLDEAILRLTGTT